MTHPTDSTGKVVYMKSAHTRVARFKALREDLVDVACAAGRRSRPLFGAVVLIAWQLVRSVICALLVLFEPLLRIVLVPIAFLAFVVTLIFGFLIGAPNFPKWGMLAFSVGALLLYWLYLGVMSLFMRLPRDRY
jgi:hypothetical protein